VQCTCIIEDTIDDRADAAASTYLAWTQNMYEYYGALVWCREKPSVSNPSLESKRDTRRLYE
jgi:hypothetical protein